ncbi:exodeoxyribonuclease V subunit beta [Methylosoma difficile]
MQTQHFSPTDSALLKGINLLEASAGTGKTYAIAMLVLRFVVEQGLPIDQILVVTFTKAATEELKTRIRARLAEAKKALHGATENIDDNVLAWLERLELEPETIQQRLDLALLDIDQAGIFTIHGFCQKVLREHALESGQLFDAELTDDLNRIKQACTDDFWRQQIYPRNAWQVAVLTAHTPTPDALLANVGAIAAQIEIVPPNQALDTVLQQLQHAADQAQAALSTCTSAVQAALADQTFKPAYGAGFAVNSQQLHAWLAGETCELPSSDALSCLTAQGLQEGLNGNKFRTTKAISGEQRKTDYLAQLNINTVPFDALVQALKQIPITLRRNLLETLRQDLDKRLQQLNVLSFDGLIARLAEALQSDKGEWLAAMLRQRFAAALIDEFQDTDEQQWLIFSRIFATDSHYLYLIGDPKQAVYKFRGADIYAYLAAQQQAEHTFTLGKNWRSHPQLVAAVNTLFAREQAFFLDDLSFHPVAAARHAEDGELYFNGQAVAPLQLWQLPPSDSKNGYWSAGKAANEIALAVANETVNLLNNNFRLQPDGKKVQPHDIAILVRSNSQARDYQELLRQVGVPAVLNSTESVFAATEAFDLYTLLQAIAHPGDTGLLKQALALDWFGLDGHTLHQLSEDETALDSWLTRFLDYFQAWQQHGLMAMMQTLLKHEHVKATLAKLPLAERRLTNLHHVLELVQQAVVDEHLGINKTLNWLQTAIHTNSSAESQQLRLESDANAVQIVTMHRAKGLEYPIVFCPVLWHRNNRIASEKDLLICHVNGRMVADLGSDDFESHRQQALKEELAEDLRLLYVAITRAKACCYLAWADVRSNDKPNDSALAWLLDFADADFAAQQNHLQSLAQQTDTFAYQLLTSPAELDGLYQKPTNSAELRAQNRRRSLYTTWQMSSYTALSALSLQDTPELPTDKAREAERPEPSIDDLPKGAHTGNVVHELLETIAFSDLASGLDISEARDKACQRYGLKLEQPAVLDVLLQTIVQTPLSSDDLNFCLKNLSATQCLKEMPFYLSMQTLDASHINAILQDQPSYQSLTAKTMSGYLTGFIDLVCEHQGRFYVMDYKTNTLPDYQPDTLTAAMREHNYGLQYWLYTVVLHRYLQSRVTDYDFDQHFGGIRYLFVRGMQADEPMSGVYEDRPDLFRVEALAGLFG